MQAKYTKYLAIPLIALYLPLNAVADDKESTKKSAPVTATTKGDLHEFIMMRILPGKRNQFLEFLDNEFVPMQKKDPATKNLRYYVEDRGEWDVIMVMTFNDYGDIATMRDGIDEQLKQKYPNEKDQGAYWMKFESFMAEHKHMFYADLPKFTK